MRNWLHRVWFRLQPLWAARRIEREMSDELRAHLEMATEANIANGMTPAEARHAATREFGGVAQIEEHYRDQRGLTWVAHLWQDLRYGARVIRHHPTFATIAIGSLALGLGVNLTMFSLLNAVMFRPLPGTTDPERIAAVSFDAVPYAKFEFFRDHAQSFDGMAATEIPPITIRLAQPGTGRKPTEEEDRLEPVNFVSGNYFSVLGVQMERGRGFLPEEDRTPGARPVLVLSHWFWTAKFQADPHIVGKTLLLNDVAFIVVGVAPANFLLEPGLLGGPRAWIPLAMLGSLRNPGQERTKWTQDGVHFFGRLKPRVAVGEAEAELDLLDADYTREYEKEKPHPAWFHLYRGFTVMPWERTDTKLSALGLLFAASVVLLVACANVATLLLARATTRQREISVRLAMGASRGRIVRQLLTESVMLSCAGGGLGLWIAAVASRALWPRVLDLNLTPDLLALFGIDGRMAIYTSALAIVTGIAFGLVPTLEATKSSISSALKQEHTMGSARVSRSRLRGFLVSGQVAVSVTLLIAASLAARSGLRTTSADFAFETGHLFWAECELGKGADSAAPPPGELQRELVERVRALPGVKAVALADAWWTGGFDRYRSTIDGEAWTQRLPGKSSATLSAVAPEFFSTVGLSVVHGRTFTPGDARSATPVYVVGESFAQRVWPDGDAVGHRLKLDRRPEGEIVGVVKNGVQVMRSRWERIMALSGFVGEIYEPLPESNQHFAGIWVRTEIVPTAVMRALPGEGRKVDRSLAVRPAGTMSQDIDLYHHLLSVVSGAIAAVGALALLLALSGVYGAMAYAAAQRTHEIGVRMALGAERSDVMRLMLWEGARLVAWGLSIGAVGCAIVATLLRSALDGLSPLDPVTFVGVTALMAITTLLASWYPAWRATKVDPMIALRCE